MAWGHFDSGSTVGATGSENGTIVRDLEHEGGARITIEEGCDHAPYSITCGIYGWFFHTRYLSSLNKAESECDAMHTALSKIIAMIPQETDPDAVSRIPDVSEAISSFVDAFP